MQLRPKKGKRPRYSRTVPGCVRTYGTRVSMDEKLTIFIAVTSAAVVLQMLMLLGMYLTLRTLSAHINSLADEVKSQVFPLLESGTHLLDDIILETSSPKVGLVLD